MRHHTRRWALPLVLAAVTTAGAAAPAVADALPAPSGEEGAPSYVALGDSYAAGPLIPVQTGEPAGCQRSTENYPAVVASVLGLSDFRDATCSAATTEHFTAPQTVKPGVNDPQF
ncbi:MAG TPA: SGNH/GDSL hydrolase family protein, partial [Pseudonocardia sp.]